MVAADSLLMLSGGLDSAWCLWQRVEAGLPTRTHHVALRDPEGRERAESAATRSVLRWMRRHGGKGLIEHTESRVDWGTLGYVPQNFHLWAYWAGVIMASPGGRDITTVILPRHSDAFADDLGPAASDSAYRTHVREICGREPELGLPMVHLTKAEVVQQLPADLLAACWWCRRPNGRHACHKCATCRLVDPALAARRLAVPVSGLPAHP